MSAMDALPMRILDRIAFHLYKMWEEETYFKGRRDFTEIYALLQARRAVAELNKQIFCEFLHAKGVRLNLCGEYK